MPNLCHLYVKMHIFTNLLQKILKIIIYKFIFKKYLYLLLTIAEELYILLNIARDNITFVL